ncbi:MAG: peptidoglycan-binding domain-containing protein [Candidatus Komeilibacteria bacterium]|nr:peptidoglycan-binding domain-containing protein [Candidatus Komeilibacteria bacterium]
MKTVFLKTITITALLGFLVPAFAFAQNPGIPHQFFGTVHFASGTTPNGLSVEAKIDGVVVGSSVTASGNYGYNPDLLFVTDNQNTNTGKTIEFYVSGIKANETAIFTNGASNQLNLTVPGSATTPAPAPTPTPSTPAPAPAPVSGGGGGGFYAVPTTNTPITPIVTAPVVTTPAQAVLGVKLYADGALLRGSDKKIYVVESGQLKHITSLSELAKYAGKAILNVSDDVIASYGQTVAGQAVLGVKINALDNLISAVKFGDKNEQVRALQTELQKQGFFQKNLKPTNYFGSITAAAIKKYQSSAPSAVLGVKTYANGALLRGSDKKIYVLVNGQKQHITSLAELAKYRGQKIYDVNDAVVNSY